MNDHSTIYYITAWRLDYNTGSYEPNIIYETEDRRLAYKWYFVTDVNADYLRVSLNQRSWQGDNVITTQLETKEFISGWEGNAWKQFM